jgi:hypothetical protein
VWGREKGLNAGAAIKEGDMELWEEEEEAAMMPWRVNDVVLLTPPPPSALPRLPKPPSACDCSQCQCQCAVPSPFPLLPFLRFNALIIIKMKTCSPPGAAPCHRTALLPQHSLFCLSEKRGVIFCIDSLIRVLQDVLTPTISWGKLSV